MNNRERVLASLNHKQSDKVPYHIRFTNTQREKMIHFYNDKDFESKIDNCFTLLRCYKKVGSNRFNSEIWKDEMNSWEEIKPNIWLDEFGVEWYRSMEEDIGIVRNVLINNDNISNFVLPDPDDVDRYVDYRKCIEKTIDGFIVVVHGFSLFERAWILAGMENVLSGMLSNKKFIHTLLDKILDFNLRVIDNVCSYDIDAILFGDDWGIQNGLIMGPELWREFIKPRVKKMYARTKKRGKYVFIHSCGMVDELFPELIEMGVDVFNPFQPEVMNVFELKKIYGDRLCFYGGISTQRTLPFGSISEVKDEVNRLIDEIGKDGGYFLSPSHNIPGDAKPENVHAMIEILQQQ